MKAHKYSMRSNIFVLDRILSHSFFFGYATTQLARQVQQKRKQVVCSNKVGRKRLARRHSRNGP